MALKLPAWTRGKADQLTVATAPEPPIEPTPTFKLTGTLIHQEPAQTEDVLPSWWHEGFVSEDGTSWTRYGCEDIVHAIDNAYVPKPIAPLQNTNTPTGVTAPVRTNRRSRVEAGFFKD